MMMLVFEPVMVEELARDLHISAEEARRQEATCPPPGHPGGLRGPYIEAKWDDLTEKVREGRRIQARYLFGRYDITPKKTNK
ncbi:hypothetical protein [Pyramidobacter piscolens]|uniref:hypothetical protein n=1 Tax=Pyramidobacter piscolens TaxID=638849 RepID=UPI0026661C3C|nr:hypothetical protein [Pyramidobacter piscolens]